MKYTIICALDPGVSGGITILDGDKEPKLYRIPVENIVVNKKSKKEYDLKGVVGILEPYRGKNVLYVQERVGVMPGQGGVSNFNFGKSAGSTFGIATALGFDTVVVSPSTWKKIFPELNDGTEDFRQEIKDLKKIQKTITGKTKKDIEQKKENKKLIEKLGRKVKSIAKTNARMLVSKLYPSLVDNFKQVNEDGVAESLLMALYGKEKQDELV